MAVYRALLVWAAGIAVVLGLFLVFVAIGWPGQANGCIFDTPNTCYCEAFDVGEVLSGSPGVRQPVNTWSNLYAIVTAFIVALVVTLDRKVIGTTPPPNLMQSTTAVPDLYVFAVLFLGLGSMWYHGSLTTWGGVVDGMSMYIYAAFLVFYSIRRFWASSTFFWVGYALTVALFTTLHGFRFVPSFVYILILVGVYLIVEVYIWVRSGVILQGKTHTVVLWLLSVAAILTASYFWTVSQTGQPLCDAHSLFQPHAMLWHPLAGVMAVLMVFYWRAAHDPV